MKEKQITDRLTKVFYNHLLNKIDQRITNNVYTK